MVMVGVRVGVRVRVSHLLLLEDLLPLVVQDLARLAPQVQRLRVRVEPLLETWPCRGEHRLAWRGRVRVRDRGRVRDRDRGRGRGRDASRPSEEPSLTRVEGWG